MNSQANLDAGRQFSRMIGLGCVILLTSHLYAQQQMKPMDTEIKHIGTAEAKTVVNTGYFSSRQPEVYWHDQDWNIDLLIPPDKHDPYLLSIRSSGGNASILKLPYNYGQINSIYRAPDDKAIIDAECGGNCNVFAVIDLKQGMVIDEVSDDGLAISPNGRFILYGNGINSAPGTDGDEEQSTHLYDTLKTPLENTCGYRDNDPEHKDLDEEMRGFQVFPQKPGQILCTDEYVDENDDNMPSNFTWSADSSKVVFADMKSGVMSLVAVMMPVGTRTPVCPRHQSRPSATMTLGLDAGSEIVSASAPSAPTWRRTDYPASPELELLPVLQPEIAM